MTKYFIAISNVGWTTLMMEPLIRRKLAFVRSALYNISANLKVIKYHKKDLLKVNYHTYHIFVKANCKIS